MPLLDLKTDLKSLKYGQDQPGGGSSGQPYIQTDINTVDNGFINKLRFTKFDDGLIRGGAVGAANAAIVDTLRIGKFFTDAPQGPLFLIKQVGLQLSNPRVESSTIPTNRPTRGQGLFTNVANFIVNTAGKIENAVGPTRIYNIFGTNTLAQVPVNAIGGHIVRHGLLPNNDDSKYYENVIKVKNFQNNSNRLVDLTNNFNLGPWGSNKTGVTRKEQGFLNKLKGLASFNPIGASVFAGVTAILNTNKEFEIDSYIGGPSSVYGLGSTTIRRAMDSDTENETKINFAREQSRTLAGKTRDDKGNATDVAFGLDRLLGASNQSASVFIPSGSNTIYPLSNNDTNIPVNLNNRIISSTDKNNPYEIPIDAPTVGKDFGASNFTSSIFVSSSFPDLPTIKNPNSPLPNKVANQGDKNNPFKYEIEAKNENDIVSGSGPSSYPDAGLPTQQLDQPTLVYNNPALNTYAELITKQDTLGLRSISQNNFQTETIDIDRNSPNYQYNTWVVKGNIGSSPFDRINDRILNADEIKVQFSPIHPFTGVETPIQFLAYLTAYNESYNSTWNDVKYVGRAEKFYIFNEFKRTANIGFRVPCFNSDELQKNHEKLFKLGGKSLGYALAGQYNTNTLLGGVIIKATVGSYLVNTPGIITDMKFDIEDGSSWDLDAGYAHILKIDLGFTVIGNQLPIYESTTFAPPPPPPNPTPTPPPPPPPPPIPKKDIPPARDQSIGTALTGINNQGVAPVFGSQAQEDAFFRARGFR